MRRSNLARLCLLPGSRGDHRVALNCAPRFQRAFDRGVKLIGATAHYATKDLDEGPIIEQDVVRVTHREHAVERIGADVERLVLARAVSCHLQDRVLLQGRRTIVF